jgi:hypothetical protein
MYLVAECSGVPYVAAFVALSISLLHNHVRLCCRLRSITTPSWSTTPPSPSPPSTRTPTLNAATGSQSSSCCHRWFGCGTECLQQPQQQLVGQGTTLGRQRRRADQAERRVLENPELTQALGRLHARENSRRGEHGQGQARRAQ